MCEALTYGSSTSKLQNSRYSRLTLRRSLACVRVRVSMWMWMILDAPKLRC